MSVFNGTKSRFSLTGSNRWWVPDEIIFLTHIKCVESLFRRRRSNTHLTKYADRRGRGERERERESDSVSLNICLKLWRLSFSFEDDVWIRITRAIRRHNVTHPHPERTVCSHVTWTSYPNPPPKSLCFTSLYCSFPLRRMYRTLCSTVCT